jgi:hypothetical protein
MMGMENQSPFLAMQRVEAHIKALLRNLDTDLLTADEKKATASLRRFSVDLRLDIRDYELSETRVEQLQKADEAKKRLSKVKANLLMIGTLLSPADVAQLDAELEYIKSRLF